MKEQKLGAAQRKNIQILGLCLVICVIFALGAVFLRAPASVGIVDWETVHTYGDSSQEHTKIGVQTIRDAHYLFLPSTASPDAVTLFFDIPESFEVSVCSGLKRTTIQSGDTIDLTSLCREGKYKLTLKASNGEVTSKYSLKLSFTDHIGTMYLVSDDPQNEGRVWVESSPDKSNKATGNMILQNEDGSVVYHDALTQIKGRGNSTWEKEKKPYQIKLSEKTDLLQTGQDDNKSKTWVLLANYLDPTTMRNSLIYNLGKELGMEFCTENNWVNLYYDGEYRGCYLLSEKVEVNSGRVDITDLEELNEEANEGVDFEALPVETCKTSNGATYTYCVGMNAPEDITGGYLLELEFDDRAEAEICRFITQRGQNVVVKSPEYASMEEMDYIASLYQEWEDAIYNGGVNPATGKSHGEYVDLRSAAICYLANEFSKNQDGFESSAYFYKDHDGMMYMGPLWDYDMTLNFSGGLEPTGLYTARAGLGAALCALGDFRDTVKQMYLEEFYPLIKNVVLGDPDAVSSSGEIRSIRYYDNLLADSAACNELLWVNDQSWKQEVTQLREFVSERAEYLEGEISTWSADASFAFPESAFTDVRKLAWYYEDVYKAFDYGLMSGSGDEFNPDQESMRCQAIQTIYNMAGNPLVSYSEVFDDVKQNYWYANAVTWGVNTGVVIPEADGMFEPTGYISREEVIVFLYRYMGSPEVEGDQLSSFADAEQVSDYAKKAMQWAIEEDILVTRDKKLRPLDTATRAELASLAVHCYEQLMAN